ncbi:MAG: SDR family oxidoreductase [Dehalococcoidia bacterium]|jgi:3-oxoacyl-[acyl-carrier protein] reductase|nr:SDR family oxidoreductase [Dehalococcoidia bacterium]MDP6228403.1 SDR family oxidoreductase [Dehalococcoidia bacterium]MDP7083745.1 SDR family oxidoreductase [Dehalococcoidia bacterium]MDP7202040.1 SDR family oxidoreductase [Dehalococcoidia bacterium]MDP7511220.1 SDR family oxidoreductase [Dehalococcoidia bacterium]
MNLEGAAVIVTGSGTGLGAAVAKHLSSKGAKVVINYSRSEAEARATVEECEKLGAETLLCRGDVAVDEDCRRMASQTIAKWGRIDGLVNNAGRSKFVNLRDLEALSADDFLTLCAVNVVGPFQMARAVAPQMKAQGKGAIVNVSSTSGISGSGSSIAYAASKGALNTMTLSLARALGPEIRVNSVCPGFMQTRWWWDVLGNEKFQEKVVRVAEGSPLKAAGTPEAVAEPVVWLLEGAEHMTGQTFIVDGGLHLIGFPG